MTYDDVVRECLVHAKVEVSEGVWALTIADVRAAIPSLTLKTEDGRFVKVEAERQINWDTTKPFYRTVYRIVEEP